MRFLMQIGSVVWKAVTWLFYQIVRLVKWAINKLPGLREGIAKWTQTLLFYVALGAVVLVLCMLPLPLWGKAIGTLGFALLLSFATVIRTRAGISEQDVRVLQDQKAELEARLEKQRLQIEKLKVDMQNQRYRLLDMNWIWEINLAQLRTQYTKVFDYFIRGRNDPVLWGDKPTNVEDGDKRAIGALQIDYTAKVGIDLKQVLVCYDREKHIVKYSIPEPYQTGAVDPADKWQVRATLEYSKGDKFGSIRRDWRWHDEDVKNTALPIWEQEKTAGYKDAFASKALQDQLGSAIQGEADRRLKAFFETLLNCEARAVPRGELQSPDTLGAALPTMLKEMTLQGQGQTFK